MDNRQENFERNIILESELATFFSKDGDPYNYTIDDYPNKYLTLSEVASEYGRDLDFEDRQSLQIIIKERFKQLNDIQRKIAELKYLEDMSVREIGETVNRAISTVQYHINKINDIIRSI